jgi:hypothetical protein
MSDAMGLRMAEDTNPLESCGFQGIRLLCREDRRHAPCERGPPFRKPLLYPTELRGRAMILSGYEARVNPTALIGPCIGPCDPLGPASQPGAGSRAGRRRSGVGRGSDAYRSVSLMSAWPRISLTAWSVASARISWLAVVCRRSWNVRPARATAVS